MVGTHLSRLVGLQRTGVSHVRVPPGKESFTYHSHTTEEEWMFVLSGRGIAKVDGEELEIAAGDFLGFPTGTAHHVRNPYAEELVYLMGGENRDVEIADFPDLGRRMVKRGNDVTVYDLKDGRPMSPKK
jgi:uncharacterized cupin superfamily protein